MPTTSSGEIVIESDNDNINQIEINKNLRKEIEELKNKIEELSKAIPNNNNMNCC